MDQRAGDRDPLLLPARQIRRALLDISLVAVRHALDEFFGAGQTRRIDRTGRGQPGAPRDDVVADRPAKQKIVLQHDPEALPQMPQIDLAQILAGDQHELERRANGGRRSRLLHRREGRNRLDNSFARRRLCPTTYTTLRGTILPNIASTAPATPPMI